MLQMLSVQMLSVRDARDLVEEAMQERRRRRMVCFGV